MGKGKKQSPKKKAEIKPKKDYTPIFWLLGILTASLIAYIPAFRNGLTNFDDLVYVSENPLIREFNWKNLVSIFSEFYYGGYYPLTLLSFMIDFQIGGLDADIFHFTNIMLHLGTTALVFIFVRQLFEKIDIAIIAALIFGVHTLHVESVAWVSERKDVLYALFFFASLISYHSFLSRKKQTYYVWALLLFLLSVLAKTMAVALAPTLLLLDWYHGRKLLDRKVILEKIPFFVIGILFGILAIKSQSSIGAIAEETTLPILHRFVFASYAYTMYIVKSIFPFGLSAFYPYPVGATEAIPGIYWLSLILPLGSIGLFIFLIRKKMKDYAFAVFFFILNIVLVLQLVQINDFVMADRFMYVASLGLFLLLAFLYRDLIKKYPDKLNIYRIGILAYAFILLIMTSNRSNVWKDSITLWDDVIDKFPDYYKAWNQRGMAKADEVGDYQAALLDYNEAIKLNPDFATTYINRGFAYMQLGNITAAMNDYNKAIEILPDYSMAYNNRGIAKANNSDLDGAIADFTKAIEIDENHVSAYTNRGLARSSKQDWEGAMADFNTAIDIQPNYAAAYNYRGLAYSRERKLDLAFADFNTCLELMPNHAEALYNRGVLHLQMNHRRSACEDLKRAADLGFQRAYGMIDQYCN
jgi:tetratricopeptide (TPR) repeat protein